MIHVLLSALMLSPAGAETMPLTYAPACVFQAVAAHMRVQPSTDKALPVVHLQSQTPLKQFQEAVEAKWKIRPESFMNIYFPDTNEIYLNDDEASYRPRGRYVDDSLAHELTHFVQVVYQDALNEDQDALEKQAVEVQTWFREVYMMTGESPCAGFAAM